MAEATSGNMAVMGLLLAGLGVTHLAKAVAAAHCGEAFGQKAAEKVQRAGTRQAPK